MAQELAIRDSVGGVPAVQTIAQHFVKSGFFKDARDMSQAVVRIMSGAEMGFGPFASMQGVYIIEGKPSIAAGLMASAIRRSGRYDYRILAHTDQECSIEFRLGREVLGVSTFTMQNAQEANLTGKGPWKQYPRNMLFARAMSNGARFHCPDIFAGPVYTPEELGADVDEDGTIVQSAQPAPVIRNLSSVRVVDPAPPEVLAPAAEPAPSPLDIAATLTYLQKLPPPDAYSRQQRDSFKRLCDERLPAEAARYGLELPAREAGMDPAAWAANALLLLAERDDSQPF